MKTAEEILRWLTDTIGHIYERPEMYACTLRELDHTLYSYHFLLGFITEQGDIMGALADLCKGKYRSAISNDHEGSRVIERPQLVDFKLVLDHWQKVDAQVGLVPTRGT
jgi:hypothetical protein